MKIDGYLPLMFDDIKKENGRGEIGGRYGSVTETFQSTQKFSRSHQYPQSLFPILDRFYVKFFHIFSEFPSSIMSKA